MFCSQYASAADMLSQIRRGTDVVTSLFLAQASRAISNFALAIFGSF